MQELNEMFKAACQDLVSFAQLWIGTDVHDNLRHTEGLVRLYVQGSASSDGTVVNRIAGRGVEKKESN